MTTPAVPLTDAELIARTRTGDMSAYDGLYRRHVDDARRVARIVTGSSDEAEDVVSEAFTRILDRLQHGGGPDGDLTPYLNTVVRRLAIDRYRASRRDGLPADPTLFEVMPETDDPISRSADRELVRRAFETLPERWQRVLWHTEIEGRSPAALAPSLGSTPNAVAALAYRAREGLRQAYLSVHLSASIPEECRPYVPRLAAYVRGTLSPRDDRWVAAHLEQCPHCRDRRDELMLLVADLRGVLWPALLLPVVLGGAKTAAVAGAAGAAGAVAGATGGSGAAGAVGGWFAGIPKPKSLAGQIATSAAAVAAVSVVVVATAFVASNDDDPPPREQTVAAAPADPGGLGPPASVPRPSPTPSLAPPSTVLPPASVPPAGPAIDPPVDPLPVGADPTVDPPPPLPAEPSPIATPSPSGTPAPSTVAPTPTATSAPAPTGQPTPAPSPTPTVIPSPTVEPTPEPTRPTPTPTAEPTPAPSPTPTAAPPPGRPPWWWCLLIPWWPRC